MTEMYGAGPVHHRVPHPRHDWKKAKGQWLQLQSEEQERAVEAVRERMRLKRNVWSQPLAGVAWVPVAGYFRGAA